jgi:hypothetical protein
MTMPYPRFLTFLGVGLFCGIWGGGANVSAQQAVAKPTLQVQWMVELDQDGRNHTFDRISMSESGERIFAVEKICDADRLRNASLTLWELSAQGEVEKKTRVFDRNTQEITPPVPGSLAALLALPNNELLLIGRIETEAKSSLMRVNADRQVVWHKPFPGELALGHYRGAVLGPNQTVLVYGGLGAKGVVARFDLEGRLLSKQLYDRGKVESVEDLISSADGETMLLVAETGTKDKFGLGPAEVRLMHCDAGGKVLRERLFAGRAPRACGPLIGDRNVVIFDTEFRQFTNNSMAAYGAELTVSWHAPIGDLADLWVYQPAAVRMTPDYFLVAGQHQGNTLRLRAYSAAGDAVATVERIHKRPFGQIQAAATDRQAIVSLSTRYTDQEIYSGTLYGLRLESR